MQEDGKVDLDIISVQNLEELEFLDVYVDDIQNDFDFDIFEIRILKAGGKVVVVIGNEVMDISGGERVLESFIVVSFNGNKDSLGFEKVDIFKTIEVDFIFFFFVIIIIVVIIIVRFVEKIDDNKFKRSVGFVWYIVFVFFFF